MGIINNIKKAFRPSAYVQRDFVQETKAGNRRIKLELVPSTIGPAKGSEYRKAILYARAQYTQERLFLYDSYRDAIDFDAHLRGLIEKRLLSTCGRKLQYVHNGEPHEPTQELIDSPVFETLRKDYLMRKVFYGMGLILFWQEKYKGRNWMKYMDVDPKHIDPYAQMIRVRQMTPSEDDYSFEKDNRSMFIGEPDNFGLLLPLALIAIHRRAAMNDWAAYSQLVGTNFRQVLIRDGQDDPKALYDAAKSVMDLGGGTLAHSADVEVRFDAASSTSQNQHFTDYMQWTADEMTKLVLGQTMTTEDGSSRSQSEVHERVQETIFDADAKAELDWLNYHFYEIQRLYDIPDGGKWEHVESATLKQLEEVELDLKLRELGLEFDADDLRERYKK